MRNAEIILSFIRKRGQRKLPVECVYRLLYQPDLYLKAYGKIYRNDGAMTPGVTPETIDGMSLEKINDIIALIRQEQYKWNPVRRTYIAKKNGQKRPLGLPGWSDKLIQEVIRMILDAYYEPQFNEHSHGFRPKRGCHTALRDVAQQGSGTKWFVEGDIKGCFDKIDHKILLNILEKSFLDNRFIYLIKGLLKAGYMENWKYNSTHSGVPQWSIVGPVLSNIVLHELDTYVENTLIPEYNHGKRRRSNPPYVRLTMAASQARKLGDLELAKTLNQKAQCIPSRNPNDPDFRRLWYVRYADDWLLGIKGPKSDAIIIKQKITLFLTQKLKLELSKEKTLITHAKDQKAFFLGYEIHTLHSDSKHDHRGQRCINGSIGLRVPFSTRRDKCRKYMRKGKPQSLPQRTIDDAYSMVSQYQSEYRGVVQYYRMAYNLHTLGYLRMVTEVSLVKTLAKKFKTTCSKIYKRYRTTLDTEEGIYKVLQVTKPREGLSTLQTYFGGISLKWNKWVSLDDNKVGYIWNQRSELVQRLLAKQCELCQSTKNIEVHHIRKLADLQIKGQKRKPQWMIKMAARQRKTLVVCRSCHESIHYGRYDETKLSST